MPWLKKRTLILFVRAAVRRYEPGVGEGTRVEVVEAVKVVEPVQIVEVQGGHSRPRLVRGVQLVMPLKRGRDSKVHGHGLVGQHGAGQSGAGGARRQRREALDTLAVRHSGHCHRQRCPPRQPLRRQHRRHLERTALMLHTLHTHTRARALSRRRPLATARDVSTT